MSSSTHRSLNRLGKWRLLLAGWQLGTRAKGDPEADAVRDHREATLLLRAEQTALAALLIKKGVITQQEFEQQLGEEADYYNEALSRRFPGVTASDTGLHIDTSRAELWIRNWKP